MPLYPPRTQSVKKHEELTKRETDLKIAINLQITNEKLIRLADKYRQAQLSLLKAKIHLFRENEFKNKDNTLGLEKLEELTKDWTNKSFDDIISEVKRNTNI